MKTTEMECPTCGVVQAKHFGMVPKAIVEPEKRLMDREMYWVKTKCCPHCGNLEKIDITADEMRRAQNRILEFYEENELA